MIQARAGLQNIVGTLGRSDGELLRREGPQPAAPFALPAAEITAVGARFVRRTHKHVNKYHTRLSWV